MFSFFSKTKKSDKIIKRYINGIVNEKYEEIHSLKYETLKFTLKKRLFKAIKDFLDNAELTNNENRNLKEMEIYANAHGLGSESQIYLFLSILKLVQTNETIIFEYNQEKLKNNKNHINSLRHLTS